MLKPQDIVILLKILPMVLPMGSGNLGLYQAALLPSQNTLAALLCMSVSEVNAGIKRLHVSGLLGPIHGEDSQKTTFLPIKSACEECLISGVKYFFPVQLGVYTRGIVTSYAAPMFGKYIPTGNDPIPVWPHAKGDQRGVTLEPLYRSVPDSLIQYPDQPFYELLVLVDAIRSGRVRERNIAIKLLKEKLHDKQ